MKLKIISKEKKILHTAVVSTSQFEFFVWVIKWQHEWNKMTLVLSFKVKAKTERQPEAKAKSFFFSFYSSWELGFLMQGFCFIFTHFTAGKGSDMHRGFHFTLHPSNWLNSRYLIVTGAFMSHWKQILLWALRKWWFTCSNSKYWLQYFVNDWNVNVLLRIKQKKI